jgi:hypothetical protein
VSVIIGLIPADAEVLTLADITLTCIYAVLWMLIYNSSTEFREIYRNIFLCYFTDSVICLSLLPWHGAFLCWGWRNGLQTWRVAGNILNKQSRQKANSGLLAISLGEVLTDFHLKVTILRNTSNCGGVGSCECGNGHPDSVKCGEFLH